MNPRSPAVLLVVVLLMLAGGAGALLMGGSSPPFQSRDAEGDEPFDLPGEGSEISGDPGLPGITPAVFTDPERTVAATEADGGETAPQAPLSLAGSIVTVRDGEDGPLVEGASIAFAPTTSRNGKFSGIPNRTQRTRTENDGERVSTDGDGIAKLPRLQPTEEEDEDDLRKKGWLVLAFHEGKFAAGRVAATGGATLELELVPDETLTVLLLDTKGQPLGGIPIDLIRSEVRLRNGKPRQQNGQDRIYTRSAGSMVTDGEGQARLKHWQITRGWRTETLRGFKLRPRVLTLDDPSQEVPIDRAPPKVVVLKMPPLGRVLVQVTDSRDRLLTSQGNVYLERGPDAKGVAGPTRMSVRHQPGHNGDYVFQHVGLGLQVRLGGTVGRANLEKQVVLGPTRAGEQVSATLRVRNSYLGFSGILVAQGTVDGIPADRLQPYVGRFRAELLYTTSSPKVTTAQTAPDGSFDLWFGRRKEPPTRIVFQPVGSEDLRMASRPLIQGEGVQHVDLGEVALEEPPVLLRGLVVDDLGAPIPDVQIQASRMVRSGERVRRQRLRSVQAKSDAAGQFQLRGFLDGGTALQVRFRHPDHTGVTSEELRVPYPQQLRIQMSRESHVVIRAVAAVPFDDDQVQIRLKEEGGRVIRKGLDFRDGKATYENDDFPPGTYRVEFLANGLAKPLHIVESLVVRPGEPTEDPRLQDVLLGAGLSTFKLSIAKGPGGSSPRTAHLLLNRPAAELGLTAGSLRIDRRTRSFHLPTGVLDGVLYGSNYPPMRVTLRPGTHALVLPAQTELNLALQGYLTDLRPEFGERAKWMVVLRYLEPPVWPDGIKLPKQVRAFRPNNNRVSRVSLPQKGHGIRGFTDPMGRVQLEIPGGGKVRIQLRANVGRSWSRTVTLGTTDLAAPAGTGDVLYLQQQVTQEQMTSLLEDLRKKVAARASQARQPTRR